MSISPTDELKQAFDDGYREGRLGGHAYPYGYRHGELIAEWRRGHAQGERDRQEAALAAQPQKEG